MIHDEIAARLEEARARTFALVEPLSDDDLQRQHDVLMSPIVWDLGHIAHFEELWLVRNLEGPVEFGEMPGIFNPFENPRRVRGSLKLPTLAECRSLMGDIRQRVLERLRHISFDIDNPLLRSEPIACWRTFSGKKQWPHLGREQSDGRSGVPHSAARALKERVTNKQ